MKKILYTVTALSALLCACTNGVDEVTPLEPTATISIEVAPENRTYIDGENIYWSESGEQLNIIYYNDISTSSSRSQTATHEDYTLVDNRIQFTANINPKDGATQYTFGAFYPYVWKGSTASISLTVPQEQTPTATSYDPKADILISKEPVVTAGVPDKISFTFARMVALVKMTLVGIGEGEKIEKVVFSSPAKPAGSTTFKVHEQGTLDNAVWYNNYEDITLSRENWIATGSDDCWFVTVPTELSGSAFTVTVTTDKFNYSKTVDLTGKTLTFERAKVAEFRVKDLVKSEKPKNYKLLTDIAELNAGDQIIICTKNTATSSARALSTTASGTKLAHTSSFTIENGPQIITLPEGVALFTVENGTEAGTFTFKCDNGYLYGNYDSENWTNTLSFKATVDAETLWSVSLDSSSHKASICNPHYSRFVNYYSSSSFNFANSASYTYIYYIDGEASEEPEQPEQPVVTPLATPVVTATAEGNSVVVSWGAVAGAKNYTVTCGTTSFNTTETYATLNLEYATEYTISVVANPADSTVNSASEAGVATVTTEAAPGGGEGLIVSLTLPVEGAVVDATANTFYEGDITISSTGGWRIQSEGSSWTGLYLGSGKNIKVATTDSSKHEITKVEMTAESGGSLNFRDFTSGSTLVWEPGYGASSKTFTAGSATRVASITVYYKAK